MNDSDKKAAVEPASAPEDKRPWTGLRDLLDRGAAEEAAARLESLPTGEQARCLDRLDGDHRAQILGALEVESAADLLEHLSEVQSTELLAATDPSTAAAVLDEVCSDTQADLVAGLREKDAEQILAALPPDSAEAVRDLATYPSDQAGGLMVKEFLSYAEHTTVGELVEDLQRRGDTLNDFDVQYVYVTARAGELRGVLRLRDLLLNPWSRPVREIMIPEPVSVDVAEPLEDLVRTFEEKAYLGIPVVDERSVLVGLVHRSDVEKAWSERAEREHLKSQGIVGGEELRSMPLHRRARRRLSWLSVNVLLNVMAASVVVAYQDTIEAVIALAVFLPILSDMSGCSGNQAVAVSMRELTLGIVKPRDVFHVWRKELAVGLINGLALGCLLGLAAWLWKGNAVLGAVIGTAMALNTLVAVSIGGAVPLLLKRFRMDPALASGPILTTLTDMFGFLLVLSFAAAMLDSLV